MANGAGLEWRTAYSGTVEKVKTLATEAKDAVITTIAGGASRVRVEDTIQQLPPSFAYGRSQQGPWTEIEFNDEVQIGQILRFTYDLKLPFLQRWQAEYIAAKLSQDERYELLHAGLNEEIRKLFIEVRVLQVSSPAIIYALVILTAVAGAAIFATVYSIERLGTVEIGDTKIKLGPLLALGGLAVGALFLVRR
jgi:hypothetical protein